MSAAEAPPGDLQSRGRRLWTSLLAQDASLAEVDVPAREVALSACRTADRVEALEQLSREVPAYVETKTGVMIHPVLAEVRQQSALLSRLIAALRLPDVATGKRPQKRPPRGVQQPTAVVTAIDRARSRSRSS